MSVPPNAEGVLRAFHSSLERELPHEIAGRVTVEIPAEVLTVDGQPSYWHVPVRVGDRTVGFMDFSLDGALVRYGSRIRQSSEIGALPPDLMDMNRADQKAKASEALGPGATVEEAPSLVGDDSPTRLAWMFHGHHANGSALRVYVTPQFAWSESDEAKPETRQ